MVQQRYMLCWLQKAAEEIAKSFPACWQKQTNEAENHADATNSTDHATGCSQYLKSAPSLSTKYQTASELASPVADSSSRNRCNDEDLSVSSTQVKSEQLSKTSNGPSTSARKVNLDDYWHHQTKPSVTTVDEYSSSNVVVNQKQNYISEHNHMSAESSMECGGSVSNSNRSDAKLRIKLKVGSEVVTNTSFSPEMQTCSVSALEKMQNVVCNENGLPEQFSNDAPVICINGDDSGRLCLRNVSSPVDCNGHVTSSSSGRRDRSDSEPPSKHARMSYPQQFAFVNDNCPWIQHD